MGTSILNNRIMPLVMKALGGRRYSDTPLPLMAAGYLSTHKAKGETTKKKEGKKRIEPNDKKKRT